MEIFNSSRIIREIAMSVAIDNEAGSKEQYDSEFSDTPTVGDDDEVREHDASHYGGDGCGGFSCSPFSTW